MWQRCMRPCHPVVPPHHPAPSVPSGLGKCNRKNAGIYSHLRKGWQSRASRLCCHDAPTTNTRRAGPPTLPQATANAQLTIRQPIHRLRRARRRPVRVVCLPLRDPLPPRRLGVDGGRGGVREHVRGHLTGEGLRVRAGELGAGAGDGGRLGGDYGLALVVVGGGWGCTSD